MWVDHGCHPSVFGCEYVLPISTIIHNAVLMLGHRLRRWPNIKTALFCTI